MTAITGKVSKTIIPWNNCFRGFGSDACFLAPAEKSHVYKIDTFNGRENVIKLASLPGAGITTRKHRTLFEPLGDPLEKEALKKAKTIMLAMDIFFDDIGSRAEYSIRINTRKKDGSLCERDLVQFYNNSAEFILYSQRQNNADNPLCKIEAGKWHKIKIIMDYEAEKYVFLLNGDITVFDRKPAKDDDSYLAGFSIICANGNEGNYFYMTNIGFYQLEDVNLTAAPTADLIPLPEGKIRDNKGLYNSPPVTPKKHTHPRFLLTKEHVRELKVKVKHPEIAGIYKNMKRLANEAIDFKMTPEENQDVKKNSSHKMRYIHARSLMYVLGETGKEHARATVRYMKDYFNTIEYPNLGDITRQMGQTIIAAAMVYDWCFDVLTEEDKSFFIKKIMETVAQKEIGWPPTERIAFWGHIAEKELMFDLLGAGIAVYDEYPELYNLSAGRFFDEYIESRVMFNKTGAHPEGNAYGMGRLHCESLADFIFTRMGYPEIFGQDIGTVPLKWIYNRQPMGLWFKDADCYVYASQNRNFSYNGNDREVNAMLGNMYGNPYVVQQYLFGLAIHDITRGDESIMTLLVAKPGQQAKFSDDLPLAYATSYPLTSITARTGWQHGINSPAAMVYMNANEKTVEGHNQAERATFQLYYKGNLALSGGTYSGMSGGWGSSHHFNYNCRTISKNGMLVHDPDEKFYYSHSSKRRELPANDGGQIFRYEIVDYTQFMNSKDLSATCGLYIGPNKKTPEFSYVKTDAAGGYSKKVADFKRSMVFMDLFDENYPAAFVVFDKIDTSNKDFKKTWVLNCQEEPDINGQETIVSRTEHGFNGKLVNQTMLPNDPSITKIGGEGYESWVDGVNYHSKDKEGVSISDQGNWRIEVSPKSANITDVFLNAMYMTDYDKNLPRLSMFKEETELLCGVTVKDRMVMFSKSGDVLGVEAPIELCVRDNGYGVQSCLIADIKPGMWKIVGIDYEVYGEVTKEDNVLYFKCPPGVYRITAAPGAEKTIFYYKEAFKQKLGDFCVFDKSGMVKDAGTGIISAGGGTRFMYVDKPTKLIDGVPYVPKSLLEQFGIREEDVRLSECRAFTLDGMLYFAAVDSGCFSECEYDPIARVLKLKL